jgi:hypothetical protein
MLFSICKCRQYRHSEGRSFLTDLNDNIFTHWLWNRVMFARSRTPCWCPYSTAWYTLISILLEICELVSSGERETCGFITSVPVVGNPHKIFCIMLCMVKLAARICLFEAMVLINLQFCDFICIESCCVLRNYSISYNISTYSEFPLYKWGWEVSCRNSSSYTGLCGGLQGPDLAANN